MGAAIPLLLPLLPPDGAPTPNEGETGEETPDFFAALAVELESLAPESRPQAAEGDLGLPIAEPIPGALPFDTSDGGPALDSDATLALAIRGAETTPARGTTADGPETRPAGPAPVAAPIARPTNAAANEPDAATRQSDPPTPPSAAEPARTTPASEASNAAAPEAPAPRASFTRTRHAELRGQIRADASSEIASTRAPLPPPAEAELAKAVANPNAVPAPPVPIEGTPVAPSPIAPHSFATAAPTGEIPRTPQGSPPVPPEGLPVQIEWLAERGGGRARVQLHPAHLGQVELEVRTRGGEVEVVLNVVEAAAHAPLQSQRGALTQALASHDLELSSFEVMDRNAGERRSQQQASQKPQGDGTTDSPRPNRAATEPNPLARPVDPTLDSQRTGIDVRI